MSAAVKGNLKYRHPAFEGLSDNQMMTVYNLGHVRTLAAGESLFREDGRARRNYLILKGTVEIRVPLAEDSCRLAVLGQGELLAGMPAAARADEELSALALESLSVLEFDENALSRLPDHVQALLYRNLHRQSANRLQQMTLNQVALTRHRNGLSSQLSELLSGRSRQYEEAPVILEFLKRVPRLPPYATRFTLLLSENASIRDVVELARLDPSLTGMVLKTVNSAHYALQHKVSNFQHAALLLGFNQIYQIIVSAGLRSTMPKTAEFVELQFHSMMISVLGFEICQAAGLGNGPVVSTLGLLHDIGKSVVLLLQKQNPKLAFFTGLLDHGKVGAMLLKEWQLPGEICDTLEYQSWAGLLPPEAIPAGFRQNIAVLYLAHLCFDWLRDETGGGNGQSALFLPDYLRLLKLEQSSMEAFMEEKLLPSMLKRLNTYPQNVQNFLGRKQGFLSTAGN